MKIVFVFLHIVKVLEPVAVPSLGSFNPLTKHEHFLWHKSTIRTSEWVFEILKSRETLLS